MPTTIKIPNIAFNDIARLFSMCESDVHDDSFANLYVNSRTTGNPLYKLLLEQIKTTSVDQQSFQELAWRKWLPAIEQHFFKSRLPSVFNRNSSNDVGFDENKSGFFYEFENYFSLAITKLQKSSTNNSKIIEDIKSSKQMAINHIRHLISFIKLHEECVGAIGLDFIYQDIILPQNKKQTEEQPKRAEEFTYENKILLSELIEARLNLCFFMLEWRAFSYGETLEKHQVFFDQYVYDQLNKIRINNEEDLASNNENIRKWKISDKEAIFLTDLEKIANKKIEKLKKEVITPCQQQNEKFKQLIKIDEEENLKKLEEESKSLLGRIKIVIKDFVAKWLFGWVFGMKSSNDLKNDHKEMESKYQKSEEAINELDKHVAAMYQSNISLPTNAKDEENTATSSNLDPNYVTYRSLPILQTFPKARELAQNCSKIREQTAKYLARYR